MILVSMREHDAGEIAALLDQEADVRQDEIDAGQILASERDAEVDRDPGPAAFGTQAINREIHPDFADAPERRKHELAGPVHQSRPSPGGRALARSGGYLPRAGSVPRTGATCGLAAPDPRDSTGKISPAVMGSSVPSSRRSSSRPAGSRLSNRPCSSRPGRLTRMTSASPMARPSQAVRIAENLRPRSH